MQLPEHDLRRTSNSPARAETMSMLSGKTGCGMDRCAKSAVVSLAREKYCLDHFLAHCYEQLDMLESVVRNRSLVPGESPNARAFLEECANRTLLICLRHEHLTNLDRSRLLDILLRSGDLQRMLPNKRFGRSHAVPDVQVTPSGEDPDRI